MRSHIHTFLILGAMSLTTIFLMAGVFRLLALTAGRHAVVRAAGPAAQGKSYQCYPFSYAVCNSLDGHGYDHASFPNPLAPSYLANVQTAQEQAAIYIPLAITSACSRHVAKFLCFSYFPLCSEGLSSVPPVFPCPSFCRKVRADCEPYLRSRYAMAWPQWLDCDSMERVQSESQSLCVNETEVVVSTTMSTSVQTTTLKTPAPTDAPTTTSLPPVCGVCTPRTNVTSGTFRVAVNNYTFAAKIRIESQTVIDRVITYVATVLVQYLPNCSNSAQLPSTGALITSYDEQCSSCYNMQRGETYVVGGYHYPNSKGEITWEVPRKRGVVAPWQDKYDSKLDGWMQAAASDRTC